MKLLTILLALAFSFQVVAASNRTQRRIAVNHMIASSGGQFTSESASEFMLESRVLTASELAVYVGLNVDLTKYVYVLIGFDDCVYNTAIVTLERRTQRPVDVIFFDSSELDFVTNEP